MNKKVKGRQVALAISIYRKRQNRASVVFRKNKVLYRITSLVRVDKLLWELEHYNNNPGKACIIQMLCSRKRQFVLEMSEEGIGVLNVWELAQNLTMNRFNWKGDQEDLKRAVTRAGRY